MLKFLHIENIAVIKRLGPMSLEPGFNVFTGQTGAGKSIILGFRCCCSAARGATAT